MPKRWRNSSPRCATAWRGRCKLATMAWFMRPMLRAGCWPRAVKTQGIPRASACCTHESAHWRRAGYVCPTAASEVPRTSCWLRACAPARYAPTYRCKPKKDTWPSVRATPAKCATSWWSWAMSKAHTKAVAPRWPSMCSRAQPGNCSSAHRANLTTPTALQSRSFWRVCCGAPATTCPAWVICTSSELGPGFGPLRRTACR